jgi:hypothetical protein
MRPIFIAMLCVQVALVLVTLITIATARGTAQRPRPVWSSLSISLMVGAIASLNVVDRHDDGAFAEVLQFGAGILFGMALITLAMRIRVRRGLDPA